MEIQAGNRASLCVLNRQGLRKPQAQPWLWVTGAFRAYVAAPQRRDLDLARISPHTALLYSVLY